MRTFRHMAIVALLCGAGLAPAFAADPITVPTSTPGILPVHDAGFDWSGFYAGIYGATDFDAQGDAQYGVGLKLGANAQFNFYLIGGEVSVEGLTGGDAGSATHGQILGRAGLVVSDDLAIYAAGGYGIDLGTPASGEGLLGGGMELALNPNVSVEVRYLHGFPASGDAGDNQFTLGANFHF